MYTPKKIILYAMLCLCTFSTSALVYFMGKEWIIIRWPSYTAFPLHNERTVETTKKRVKLFFWHYGRWNHETVDILWSSCAPKNTQYIIRSLLTLLEEEEALEKKASLQSVAQSLCANDIYLSFDRPPFNEESSTFQKLMIIESILKTLRENAAAPPNIYFLVHHQPMKDTHLDFSDPWPLEGFVQKIP